MPTLIRTQQTTGREKLTSNRTYYVRTDGSDSNDGLTDSAGGAFLTIAKAVATIKTLDIAGNVVFIKLGSGTFTENVQLLDFIGGRVDIHGTLSSLEAVTSATVSAGTAGTQGTVTKVGQFAGDSYANKLCYFETDGVYRLIDSHTDDVLTLVGTAASSTTQNVTIYDWGSVLAGQLTIYNETYVQDVKISTSTPYGIYASAVKYPIQLSRTWIAGASLTGMVLQPGCQMVTYQTFIEATTGSYGAWQNTLCYLNMQWSKVLSGGGISLVFNDQSALAFYAGTILDGGGSGNGILIRVGHCTFSNAAAAGYMRVRNCGNGIYAYVGGTVIGTANNQYSGNTTDENAVSASYGYID